MGKPFSQIVRYLCSASECNNVTCGAIEFNPDPKLSLPGIATNHFDKISESEMPVVVDDQESEYNVLLVIWILVFQALQLALPVVKI